MGRRAVLGVNPHDSGWFCPYVQKTCNKSMKAGIPYPVCSVIHAERLVAVCPKRIYQADIMADVIKHCWPDNRPPENPVIAREVQMKGFGNVDFVIADQRQDGSIGQFLSIEVQTTDITGSVRPAFNALSAGDLLARRPTFGLNWDNVYKRYVTQLVRKGYFHHHWQTKIVAVLQDVVYQSIIDRFDFQRTDRIQDRSANVLFMIYKFVPDEFDEQEYKIVFDYVEGTSHANLQQAVLYARAPHRDEFIGKILKSLGR